MKAIPQIIGTFYADNFIEHLRNDLITKLSWMEYVFPAVQVGEDIDNKKRFPQIYCNDGTMETMAILPDTKVKSFIFFEIENIRYGKDPLAENEYNINLICWYNLKIIQNLSFNYDSILQAEIIDILQLNDCYNINNSYESAFSKYGKVENNLFPYGSFKLNFSVKKAKIIC